VNARGTADDGVHHRSPAVDLLFYLAFD